jgi:multiple sugar transport system permease protein
MRLSGARAASGPARGALAFSLGQKESLLGYLLVAPVLACLALLVVYPFLFAIWISFTDRTVGAEGRFIALANYAHLLGQPSFRATVWNTAVLVGIVQTLKLGAGLGIAVLLDQPIRARSFWRGLVLLPWAMPAFVAFITWKLLYAPQGGAFNLVLLGLGLVDTHVDFLSTKALAMPSVIAATFWRGFPFWVISFLAALQTVPRELYEAAAIDGAGAWQRFLRVTLPSIRHVVLVVVLLSTIWTTNGFENVWLLTQGGPSDATMTFPVLAYFGLQSLRIGEAAAVSVSMLPAFAVLVLFVAKLLQEE